MVVPDSGCYLSEPVGSNLSLPHNLVVLPQHPVREVADSVSEHGEQPTILRLPRDDLPVVGRLLQFHLPRSGRLHTPRLQRHGGLDLHTERAGLRHLHLRPLGWRDYESFQDDCGTFAGHNIHRLLFRYVLTLPATSLYRNDSDRVKARAATIVTHFLSESRLSRLFPLWVGSCRVRPGQPWRPILNTYRAHATLLTALTREFVGEEEG